MLPAFAVALDKPACLPRITALTCIAWARFSSRSLETYNSELNIHGGRSHWTGSLFVILLPREHFHIWRRRWPDLFLDPPLPSHRLWSPQTFATFADYAFGRRAPVVAPPRAFTPRHRSPMYSYDQRPSVPNSHDQVSTLAAPSNTLRRPLPPPTRSRATLNINNIQCFLLAPVDSGSASTPPLHELRPIHSTFQTRSTGPAPISPPSFLRGGAL